MATNADAEAGAASDLAVMEVQEYKQKRRLESILDSLDKVEERTDEAWDLYVMGEIDFQARDTIILRAVQAAIDDCRNLLINYAKENAEKTSDKAQDGNQAETRTADPYWHGTLSNPIGWFQYEYVDGKEEFIGLRDILNAKSLYTETWEETVEMRHRADRKRKRQQEHVVPEWVSRRAYRRLTRFLDDEYDLDIAFEETDDMETWQYQDSRELEERDNVQYVEVGSNAPEGDNG